MPALNAIAQVPIQFQLVAPPGIVRELVRPQQEHRLMNLAFNRAGIALSLVRTAQHGLPTRAECRRWRLRYHRGIAIDMKALARVGAEARLKELLAEVAEIERTFPGIGGVRRGRPPATETRETKTAVKRGRRRKMSAAEKKDVSARMRSSGRPVARSRKPERGSSR